MIACYIYISFYVRAMLRKNYESHHFEIAASLNRANGAALSERGRRRRVSATQYTTRNQRRRRRRDVDRAPNPAIQNGESHRRDAWLWRYMSQSV